MLGKFDQTTAKSLNKSFGGDSKTNRLVKFYYGTILISLVFAGITVFLTLEDTRDRNASRPLITLMGDMRTTLSRLDNASVRLRTAPSEAEANRVSNHILRSAIELNDDLGKVEKFSLGIQESGSNPALKTRMNEVVRLTTAVLEDSRRIISTTDKGAVLEEKSILASSLHTNVETLSVTIDQVLQVQADSAALKAEQRSSSILVLGILMLVGALCQSVFVFHPLRKQFETKFQELTLFKDQAQETLADLTKRSNELKAQQVDLEEKVQEAEVLTEHFKVASLRLQKVLQSLPIACVGIDTTAKTFEWNEAAERTFGYKAFEIWEKDFVNSLIPEEDRESFRAQIRSAIESDSHIRFEQPGHTCEGVRIMVEWSLMPMRNSKGEVSSVVITANDITARVMQAEQLKELAYKDALTGLHNRRSFLQHLNEVYASTDLDHPLSVILLDVDKFKVYNDTHGHPAGDALLRRVGELLREHTPAEGLPGRYGGEEFIVLLPGFNSLAANQVAELIREAIQDGTTDLFGSTASFGVSTATDCDWPARDLIEQADRALYASKRNGRNQVTAWNPAMDFVDPAA